MVQRPPRRKPHIDCIHGPIAPLHPRKKAHQWVWPRDGKGTSIWSWGRLKDVLTDKGPDMYLTTRGSPGPHRPVWSNWKHEDGIENLGYAYDHREDDLFHRRPSSQKYNFETRRYEPWNPHMLSDVKWCKGPGCRKKAKIYTRGAFGEEWWHPQWTDPWEPLENPFAHGNPHNNWDWDEYPHHG